MEKIGIICEYNPFHNGHVYHLEKIKERYPDSLIILVLNGYFLERGEVSLLSKEAKTNLALKYGVDIVLELPVLYGTQSADTFAYRSIEILNEFKVDRIVFGSESNDSSMLMKLAKESIKNEDSNEVKNLMDSGVNYPTALAKALNTDFEFLSNDLLGISYCKAILKINDKIIPETIQRTNNYLDTKSNDEIISAANIREKIKHTEDISKYIPKETKNYITNYDKNLLYKLLKGIIIEGNDLSIYLDVNEGIENRLKKGLLETNSYDELLEFLKTKRYTYNKLNRMIVHILLGIKKDDAKLPLDTLKILGINKNGQNYLNKIKKNITIPFNNKQSKIYEYEMKASLLYDLLTGENTYIKEKTNKIIIY